ncbi:hypothetical protein Bca52824_096400 [Brassica carinata]|uniref:Uncharacterized protein n=1 Tax=Brassica carinata TaxID=52824 RepID=A0A8X7P0C9_BRACI|nr:hypothetical protein Bca52824_096400 [Brassica carinata]
MAMRSKRRVYSVIKGKKTSFIDPLLHICFGGMAFSYLLTRKCIFEEKYEEKLAKEKLARELHAKEHGGH